MGLTGNAGGHGKTQAEPEEERGRRLSWEQCCRPGKREFVMPGGVFAPGPAFREFVMGVEKAAKGGHFRALISRTTHRILSNPIN